jgi:hypothetical protein
MGSVTVTMEEGIALLRTRESIENFLASDSRAKRYQPTCEEFGVDSDVGVHA